MLSTNKGLLSMTRHYDSLCSGVPLQFLDNRHFHLFCEVLRPGYLPVCPNTARTSQLPAEYAHCIKELHGKLQQENNLTVNADGWTDRVKRAVLGIMVVFADGSKSLLRSLEHSAEDHTGEATVKVVCLFVSPKATHKTCSDPLYVLLAFAGDKLAQMIIQVLREFNITARVAMLTTDNAASMVRARNIVVSTEGLQHIIPFR